MNSGTVRNELLATFLDVAQGDSTVVVLPDGGGLLVDCPAGSAPVVVDQLESAQVTRLNLVVISHSDLDHAGGIVDTIRGFRGETVELAFFPDRVRNPSPQADRKYRLLLQNLADLVRQGVKLWEPEAGQVIQYGDVTLSVLHPAQADRLDALSQSNPNNSSITLRVDYAGARILLPADLQRQGWQWMVERAADLKADVFKFPHHGAWYDGEPLLSKILGLVDPSVVIISVGSTNNYGHPSMETLKLLRSLHIGVRFLCTQATNQCHGEPESIAEQARALLPPENHGGHSFRNQRCSPCAGTITVRLCTSGITTSPTLEQHNRVIDLFANPQCREDSS